MRLPSLAIVALFPLALAAAERDHEPRAVRHLIVEPQHALTDADRASLAAGGVQIQRVLSRGRYLARVSDDAVIDSSRVHALVALTIADKIHRSAYRAASNSFPLARLKIFFNDDVAIDAARDAVSAIGGSLEHPLATEFDALHSLAVQLPSSALVSLASDDRVLVIYGVLPHQAVAYNATAAALSHVDTVQAAPYNLTGKDVVLSYFELAPPDTTHVEFGGRVTTDIVCASPPSDAQCNSTSNVQHATHVAGTMVAKGINPAAKGMAPEATLHQFRANDSNDVWLTQKGTGLKALGSVGDNNSWGFVVGWCSANCTGKTGQTWTGFDELIGGYDGTLSAVLDNAAIDNQTLMLHAAGNEGSEGGPKGTPFQHNHLDSNFRPTTDIYCYSQDGSGTVCPNIKSFGLVLCSSDVKFCEKDHHPSHNPYGSVNWLASSKNVLSVGATDGNGEIASFSSRGPTKDGRVKPELAAKGQSLISTFPNNSYAPEQGTSMATPVVTGTMALLTQQWRNTTSNPTARPNPLMLKALALAGADDKGLTGPDATYGYGFLNAKASVDLIIADGGVGKRIRFDSANATSHFDYPLTVTGTQNVRVLLSWFDPPALPLGTDAVTLAVLINDLDLKIVGPTGSATLPYMLALDDPCYANSGAQCQPAKRAMNTVDNNEEVEIAGATPGVYHVIVDGTTVRQGPQPFVVVASGGDFPVDCRDATEPNETPASAYGLALNTAVSAAICSDTDVDNFKFTTNGIGGVNVTLGTADTPLTVTISGPGVTTFTRNLAAGTNNGFGTLTTTAAFSPVNVEVKLNGTRGATGAYTISVDYPTQVPSRRHGAKH
jgi:hypothetical protein